VQIRAHPLLIFVTAFGGAWGLAAPGVFLQLRRIWGAGADGAFLVRPHRTTVWGSSSVHTEKL
jgi:hypothetical protein